MNKCKRLTLRLSHDDPADERISVFLEHTAKQKYRTVNNAVKILLYEKISEDNSDTSTEEKIVSVIRETIEAEMPKLFTALVSGLRTYNNGGKAE